MSRFTILLYFFLPLPLKPLFQSLTSVAHAFQNFNSRISFSRKNYFSLVDESEKMFDPNAGFLFRHSTCSPLLLTCSLLHKFSIFCPGHLPNLPNWNMLYHTNYFLQNIMRYLRAFICWRCYLMPFAFIIYIIKFVNPWNLLYFNYSKNRAGPGDACHRWSPWTANVLTTLDGFHQIHSRTVVMMHFVHHF